jgi:TRAP transporter TAXI family solute receptor
MTRILLCLVCLLTCLAAACTRGPGEEQLRAELEQRLAAEVKPGLFEVAALKRRGSTPLPTQDGTARAVVHYNVTLRLQEGYEFGGWEKLGPSSVAYVLGTTDKGIFGLGPGSRAGDLVKAYGSGTYQKSGSEWSSVPRAPGTTKAAPPVENTASPTRTRELVDALASRLDRPPPGLNPDEEEIMAQELARASENIERRVALRSHVYTFASGPAAGHYARFGEALVDAVRKKVPELALRHRHTEGSVENVRLVANGEADYAIVQSDIAALAIAGQGIFAGGGFTALRALGSLFPEALHVVVPADSRLTRVSELRGQRVDIGTPASGTQHNALALLRYHGLADKDLAEAAQEGLEKAIARLERGELDALFATVAAPLPALQNLAARGGIRLLSIPAEQVQRLVQDIPGLVPLTLPANVYPGQKADVATVAATALLVTHAEAIDDEVKRLVEFVFVRMPAQGGSADFYKVSKQRALSGITIPMHPGAR